MTAGVPTLLLVVHLLQLVMVQSSPAIVLDLLPQESHHVALYRALERSFGSLGLVNDGEGELGVVLARFVPDDESVGSLVLLGEIVDLIVHVVLSLEELSAGDVFLGASEY